MYPLDATTIAHPTYTQLVGYWKQVQTHGYGTVSDVAAIRVDGRTATTMAVAITRQAKGFAYCNNASSLAADLGSCAGVLPDQVLHLAIVDQGNETPTLFWESSTTDDTASPSVAAEFATWLATVRFH